MQGREGSADSNSESWGGCQGSTVKANRENGENWRLLVLLSMGFRNYCVFYKFGVCPFLKKEVRK